MKYIYISIFFLVFCLTACQKNSDVTNTLTGTPSSEPISTIDLSWWANVEERESFRQWNDIHTYNYIHNVSVKLMFTGDVLWESNTNETGGFRFPEQPVPAEGAYFLFEAPGYYNNVVKVEGESIPKWQVHMMRETFPDINGEVLTDAESYIVLTGQLQEGTRLRETWFYITNADNELLGTCMVGPEFPTFYMTTLPNQELFLHYNVACGGGVIPLGSFSESKDIGNLLDESFDFSYDRDQVYLDNVTDCSSGTKLYGYDLFYKEDNLTFQAGGNSGFHLRDCQPMEHPVLISVATQNPRKYVELIFTHTPGQRFDVPDQKVCEDDDTFLKYTVGGSAAGGDVFTFANIQPDGQMVIKQAQSSLTDENKFSIVFDGSATGSHKSNVNVVIRKYNSSNGWSYINSLGGYQLNSTITMNDEEFVEGTFSGEVMDTEEVSLGNLEGTFRARIQ